LETAPEARPAVQAWGPLKRLLFRFSFVYLVLYCFPFPLNVIPYGEVLMKPYDSLWDPVVSWTGWIVFKVDADNMHNGSGDTTYDYVRVFCYHVLAALAALVWTRYAKRLEYSRLDDRLRVYVRFFLAAVMLSYGGYKLIKSQFAYPGLDQMLQPIGEGSPMGLVWNFMGASTAYTMFTGAAEMLGGFLLAFRRTRLLGALVSIGAMTNVLMLNLCYDVPVKLFSAHLLGMAVFLTLPDLRRLGDLFLFNRRVERAEDRPLFASVRRNRAAAVGAVVFVILCGGWALYKSWRDSAQYGDLMPKPPLYGIWAVDELVSDGVVRPPLLTDGTRWRYVIFDYPESMIIRLMDASSPTGRQFYSLKLDEKKGAMALTKWKDPRWKSAFSYRRNSPGALEMEGTIDGQKIHARLRRVDDSKLLLLSRGFHWINEYPYNH
jgi:hypothetical protein